MLSILQKKFKFFSPLSPRLSFRHMEEKDLEMVMNWCKEEGWNIGQFDASAYHALDPQGHFLFLLNKQPIGAISIVKYSPKLFAIGPFIVKKEYRHKGYGKQIWQHAINLLEENKDYTAGLYSVPIQISRYANSEFKESFQVQRWQKNNIKNTSNLEKIEEGLQPINECSIELMLEYDQSLFSASRKKLFTKFIENPCIVGFLSTDNQGKVNGFGLIRPCIEGYRIGPLYADDFENAQKLFLTLLHKVNNTSVFIDAPANNPRIKSFTDYFGLDRISEADTMAMVRGEMPAQNNNYKKYAICSLEVG